MFLKSFVYREMKSGRVGRLLDHRRPCQCVVIRQGKVNQNTWTRLLYVVVIDNDQGPTSVLCVGPSLSYFLSLFLSARV